jgi:ubiquinone/menaquinone biosynthesis C-methylase UbiE
MEQRHETGATPQIMGQMFMSVLPPRTLAVALQLDLFSHLAAGHETVADLARAVGASERGTRMLADGLCALGILNKAGGRYRLPAATRAYLMRSSPDYVGGLIENEHFWEAWGKLAEAVKSGHPVHSVGKKERAEEFFPTLIRSLHVFNRARARRLAEEMGAGRTRRGLRVLDVACGSAVWSIAFAEAASEARVTAQDFPRVLEETRRYAERHGVAGRFDYLPGDLNEVAFGTDQFDIAILGNIVHSEGELSSRRLFRRLYQALRADGRLVIIDFIPNEDRTGPVPAVLFALNMLIHTESGDVFTLSEYRSWLNEAGFGAVETIELAEDFPAPAIVASKR